MAKNDEFYYDLSEQERNKAVSFLLRSLLKSRGESAVFDEYESNNDEDVNIYLAHLMFAVTTPQYRHISERYLSPYIGDIDRMIEETDDTYIKYFIFKVNADHLLIHLGIFQDLGEDAPRAHALFSTSDRQYSGRATSYYDQAAHFNHRIYRKQTAVGAVLGKLAVDFDRYRNLLRATRREFFHFSNTATDDQFNHFVHDLGRFEEQARLSQLRDEFLDAYGVWLKNRDDAARERVEGLLKEIKLLDSEFRFEMPS